MKKIISVIALAVFTLGFALDNPKNDCDKGKCKKECSAKDKKECSKKDKKACSMDDKKDVSKKDKKACCDAKTKKAA